MEFSYYDTETNKTLTSVNGMILYDDSIHKKLKLVRELMEKLYGIEISFSQEHSFIGNKLNNPDIDSVHNSNGYSGHISQSTNFDVYEVHYKPVILQLENIGEIMNATRKMKRLLNYLLIRTYNPYIYSTSAMFNLGDNFTIPIGMIKIIRKDTPKYEEVKLTTTEAWYKKILNYLK